jgi:RNA polymerase sigma-70 factor, ECF subfamily
VVNARNLGPEDIRRLCAGDPEAQRNFSEYFGRLLRIKVRVRSPGRNAQYVEDVVQETFARAFTALRDGRLQQLSSFGAFVNGVCENVSREFERVEGRLKSVEAPEEVAAADNPEEEAMAHERVARAEEVLRTLPPRDQQILRLLLVDEVDKDEICRRFGVTRDHLRVIVHRAKERFLDHRERALSA